MKSRRRVEMKRDLESRQGGEAAAVMMSQRRPYEKKPTESVDVPLTAAILDRDWRREVWENKGMLGLT